MLPNPVSAFNLQILLYPIHRRRPIFLLEGLVENGFALKAGHLRDSFDGRG